MSPPETGDPPRAVSPFWSWAAFAAALAVAAGYAGYAIDDGYVALRVGRNLASGLGLVFNPGEAGFVPQVLPYSLVAGLTSFAGGELAPLQLASLLSFLAVALSTARLARRVAGADGAVLAWLCLLPLLPVGYWAVAPADPMLAAALLVSGAGVFVAERSDGRWRGSVFLFLATAVVRPGFAGAYLFWRLLATRQGGKEGVRSSGVDVVVFTLGFAAFLLWRWSSAGVPLIDPAWEPLAAVTGGLAQLDGWVRACPFLAAMLLWPILRWRARRAPVARVAPLSALWALAFAYVGAALIAGGVELPYHASLLPVMPLLAVLLAALPVLMPLKVRVMPVLALGAAIWAALHADHARAVAASVAVEQATVAAAWASKTLAAGDGIGADAAGTIAYVADRPTRGLRHGFPLPPAVGDLPPPADRLDAVLQSRPRVIFFAAPLDGNRPVTAADELLFRSPIFRFFWETRIARVEGSPGWIHYFELATRDLSLWPGAWQVQEDRVTALVAAASQLWTEQAKPGETDSQTVAELQQEIELAGEAVQAQDLERAARLVAGMQARNDVARLPAVASLQGYVAALQGDLPGAIVGFKEQLRLKPENDVQRGQLRMMLRISEADLSRR